MNKLLKIFSRSEFEKLSEAEKTTFISAGGCVLPDENKRLSKPKTKIIKNISRKANMSKKHHTKHCHIAVDAWDNGSPLYRINVGDLEHGRFKFGLPINISPQKEDRALELAGEIDDYLDAYLESFTKLT